MREKITNIQRHKVYSKAEFTCKVCGYTNNVGHGLAIDHIIPVAEGGGNNLENYQCLCAPCNMIKGVVINNKDYVAPDISNLPFLVATDIMNGCRTKFAKDCGRKVGGWQGRKDKTLEVIEKIKDKTATVHKNTIRVLLAAISKTFGLRKLLLDFGGYLDRYEKLVKSATPANCNCVLAYA